MITPHSRIVLATALKAEVAALKVTQIDAKARIERLYLLLTTIQRATYGRRVSERLDVSQYAFAFEEVHTGLGAVEAKLENLTPKSERKSGGAGRLILERVEEIIEPHAAPCSCCACARVKIGENVSKRLDVVPSKFRVIVTRRPRYCLLGMPGKHRSGDGARPSDRGRRRHRSVAGRHRLSSTC